MGFTIRTVCREYSSLINKGAKGDTMIELNLAICKDGKTVFKSYKIKGKLEPRFIGPFCIVARRGTVAYQLDLPEDLSEIHDVFHVSQLRKCVSNPEKQVSHENIDMQPDLTYRERPIRILEESERRT